MVSKLRKDSTCFSSTKEHISRLVEWMSRGVYEKEQIIAVALLCAIAGENMFLLGPPGTAKSMVASRLKMAFKDGKSFDYLMSRFSTPDEIFGPISISKLKNEDSYERLTAGYLPQADIVFLDEIWKAGPSIQNTLLTVINEHIFHNGGYVITTPMKILIAASNELPAKDEGLEALWDRFLVRMISNCIEDDTSFFKMMKGENNSTFEQPESLLITDELYSLWQKESMTIGIEESVVNAIKSVRIKLKTLEKEDENKLRYYISDRRWRKAFRLMQTSAYLNGRTEINMSDYLLLIHSFWNDVECIPNVLKALTTSICDATLSKLKDIESLIRQILSDQQQHHLMPSALNQEADTFVEYEYFYYLIENHPEGEIYFSKWDYTSLKNNPREGLLYYNPDKKKNYIHTLMPEETSDNLPQNSLKFKRVKLQYTPQGVMIDGKSYSFLKNTSKQTLDNVSINELPVTQRIQALFDLLYDCKTEWEQMIASSFADNENIFLSSDDLALISKPAKEVNEKIRITEAKLNNLSTIK